MFFVDFVTLQSFFRSKKFFIEMLNVLNLAMCSPAKNCATNRVEKKWWEMMRIDEKIIGHIMENSLYMYLLNLDIRKKVTLAKWTFLT